MKKLFALLLFLAGCTPAIAGVSCSLPFNLQNGQPADATQVMANYNALVTCLGNAAAAGANSDITSISGLTTPLPPAQGGTPVFTGTTSTGSPNTQLVTSTTPSNFSLTPNYQVLFVAGLTNTAAATLQVGSTIATTINKQTVLGLRPLTGGEIIAGQIYAASYDGSVWQLLNPSSASSVVPPTVITGAYNVLPSDCGSTLSLGGSAFYAVTFNAPSGYALGCTVKLIDIDGGRGKGIVVSGLTASPIRLLPLQTLTVQNTGLWTVDPQAQFWNAPLTLHVNNVSGSDNPAVSDCLAIGAWACSTFQGAVNIAQLFTTGVNGNTIQADCEAAYNNAAFGQTGSIQIYRGLGGLVNIVGNAGNPLSCALITNTATTIFDIQDGQQATITGFELGSTTTSSPGATMVSSRQLTITDVDHVFFASNINGVDVSATEMASIGLTNSTVGGNANVFVLSTSNSTVQVNFVTLTGTPNISFWFDVINSEVVGTPAWAGNGSGSKYACSNNAVVALNTAYPAGFSAGAASTGCQASPP